MPIRVGRVTAARAHRGQLRQARDLNPPAFVIGKVDMKDVELVASEEIERAQDQWLRVEVAGDVEHEAAIAETRSVDDSDRRQCDTPAGSGRGQQIA